MYNYTIIIYNIMAGEMGFSARQPYVGQMMPSGKNTEISVDARTVLGSTAV